MISAARMLLALVLVPASPARADIGVIVLRAHWCAGLFARTGGRVTRRLGEIRREHDAEVRRVKGSKAEWRARDAEFQSMVRALGRRGAIPVDLRRQCAECPPKGPLFEELLRYFEARGTFSIGDEGRGAWLSLPFVDGQRYATGVSRAEILSGDPRVAVLVLAAAIDYNLHQSPARREDIASIDGLFTLFRQANHALEHPAAIQEATRMTGKACKVDGQRRGRTLSA